MILNKKQRYLQIALNSTLSEAKQIISRLPPNPRIILEAGTPLLKKYGEEGITQIKTWWAQKLMFSKGSPVFHLGHFNNQLSGNTQKITQIPYIVADYKAMDRGATEVRIAKQAGASAITVLGQAPVETIDRLIKECQNEQIDAIVDMMNVSQPHQVLRKLKKLPPIVMLHRGVDETEIGTTPLPIHLINKVKGSFNTLVAIGGGDTLREVQSAFFNGASIVMLWKKFYQVSDQTAEIAKDFLKQVK